MVTPSSRTFTQSVTQAPAHASRLHVLSAPAVGGLLAGGASLAVYLLTLAPTVFSMDSAELAAAAYSLGLVHGPGYSVYLLLGHLFTFLPLGDVAYRVNLLSAVAGAAMVGVLTTLACSIVRNGLAALLAGMALAFSYYAWSVSVVAEVYTLQGLLLVLVLGGLWRWTRQGGRFWLVLSSGILALAAANNPSSLLWWPGLLLLITASPFRRGLRLRDIVPIGGAFLLGLLPLLYLPLRSQALPAFVYVGEYDSLGTFRALDLTRPENLIWYLSGGQFAHLFPALDLGSLGLGIAGLLDGLWAAYLGVGFPLLLWGALSLWSRARPWALGLGLIGIGHAAFFVAYGAADKELMFLPVYLISAVFLAAGIDAAGRILPRRSLLLGWLLPVGLLVVNRAFIDVAESWHLRQEAQSRLETSAPGALYIAPWGDAAILHYLQVVEGQRPDVEVANTFFVSDAILRGMIQAAHATGHAVYTSRGEVLKGMFPLRIVTDGFQVLPESRGGR